MRKFFKGQRNLGFVPYSDEGRESGYLPYDPQLTVAGSKMKFIVDPAAADDFSKTHFKFLGRYIHVNLSEEGVKERITQVLDTELNLVEQSQLNGPMKLWLYQHYVLGHLAWWFLIHDLTRDWLVRLSKRTSKRLRRWIGLFSKADEGVLYRSREKFGLGLTLCPSPF
jgi:hypothetical protein